MTLDGFGPLQLPRREAPEVQVVRLLSADDSTEIVEVDLQCHLLAWNRDLANRAEFPAARPAVGAIGRPPGQASVRNRHAHLLAEKQLVRHVARHVDNHSRASFRRAPEPMTDSFRALQIEKCGTLCAHGLRLASPLQRPVDRGHGVWGMDVRDAAQGEPVRQKAGEEGGIDGRREHTVSTEWTTQAEALEALGNRLKDAEHGKVSKPADATLGALVETYLQ